MDVEIFKPGKGGLWSAWQAGRAALGSAPDAGCAVLYPWDLLPWLGPRGQALAEFSRLELSPCLQADLPHPVPQFPLSEGDSLSRGGGFCTSQRSSLCCSTLSRTSGSSGCRMLWFSTSMRREPVLAVFLLWPHTQPCSPSLPCAAAWGTGCLRGANWAVLGSCPRRWEQVGWESLGWDPCAPHAALCKDTDDARGVQAPEEAAAAWKSREGLSSPAGRGSGLHLCPATSWGQNRQH